MRRRARTPVTDTRYVPCGPCQHGYSGPHECGAPMFCPCDRTHLHTNEGDRMIPDKNAPMPVLGDRVTLLNMPDDPDPIAPGTEGTVDWIGDEAVEPRQIGVKWDNGRSLLLLQGVDLYEIASKPTPPAATPAELRRADGRS
jgi:hypothetical protein